jgi:hypothetical protein
MVDRQAISRLTAYLHANGITATITRDDATDIGVGERLL